MASKTKWMTIPCASTIKSKLQFSNGLLLTQDKNGSINNFQQTELNFMNRVLHNQSKTPGESYVDRKVSRFKSATLIVEK